jgi:hypothetical protein
MRVVYSLYYPACWACCLTTEFGVYTRFLYWKRYAHGIVEIVEVFGKDSGAVEKALNWLYNYPPASSVRVLSKTDDGRRVTLRVTIPPARCPLYTILAKYSSDKSSPVEEKVDSKGKVYWTLEVKNLRKANLIAKYIRQKSLTNQLEMKIIRGRPPSIDGLYVLKRALEEGYFDVPKKISARELSKKLGIPLSTFDTQLRRALKRVLSEVIR